MDLVLKMLDEAAPSSELARQSRDFGFPYPIINWIGALVVLYLVLYVLSYYVGPALFGTRYPYYRALNTPFPYQVMRNLPANGGLPLNPEEAQRLTQQVTRAIHR